MIRSYLTYQSTTSTLHKYVTPSSAKTRRKQISHMMDRTTVTTRGVVGRKYHVSRLHEAAAAVATFWPSLTAMPAAQETPMDVNGFRNVARPF